MSIGSSTEPVAAFDPTPGLAPEHATEIDAVVARAKAAQAVFASFTQEQVDHIFRSVAMAVTDQRIALAKDAVAETGMGVVEDKVIKNHFASEYIYHAYKDTKTCGIVEDDRSFGFRQVAAPVGLVAAIVPTTNPTSTAIFKALLALKTRNGLIVSPHPRAKGCTARTVDLMHAAAVKAGAPDGILGVIRQPSVPASTHLMHHPDINMILATGGTGMVRAAYSSGKPAIGVGAGNTPVVIDETAHVRMAVSSVLMSKTFDHGVICASEQAVVVVDTVYEAVKTEFVRRGAVIVEGPERQALADLLVRDRRLNPEVVGQPAAKIAAMAGFEVHPATKVLIAEADLVGWDEPFSYEKLSPVLGLFRAADFDAALQIAREIVIFGGAGHTAVLYTDEGNQGRITRFAERMTVGRVLVNMPSSQGAIGDVYNFKLPPSLTLGCGSWGGNSVSENIGVKHLMNLKAVAERRENMQWFKVPPKIYFKPGALPLALQELSDRKRALIVTDKTMVDLGFVHRVQRTLEETGLSARVFSDIKPDPDLANLEAALVVARAEQPDAIVAVGGGSPIDAAKIIWLMYENPDLQFHDIALRFLDIRKRIYRFPEMGRKAVLVAVPTTSGTGSEVTPFAVITDERTGVKYPIADYELTPDMAIVDPDLVMSMPRSLTAHAGLDALTHAIESYTSVFANNFSDGNALEAIRLLFKYLKRSYDLGAEDPEARGKVHYAATIAGMSFSNAFLGVCHSMAHKLGATFHLPHGLANALLISHVIRYNATDVPVKQGLLPAYRYPFVKGRYGRIADHLHLADDLGDTDPEREIKVRRLITAIEQLKADLGTPASIAEAGVAEADFMDRLDVMCEQAFDDQCTGGNPRYPLIAEIRALYLRAFHGDSPLEHIVSVAAAEAEAGHAAE